MNLLKRIKGFTLTELLLTMTILAFSLVSLLVLFISCILLNEANRNFTIASSHAQFAMEEVKNTNFSSITTIVWDSAAIAVKGLAPLNNESINIAVTGVEPLNIVTTVNWRDRGLIDRAVTLDTLITEP